MTSYPARLSRRRNPTTARTAMPGNRRKTAPAGGVGTPGFPPATQKLGRESGDEHTTGCRRRGSGAGRDRGAGGCRGRGPGCRVPALQDPALRSAVTRRLGACGRVLISVDPGWVNGYDDEVADTLGGLGVGVLSPTDHELTDGSVPARLAAPWLCSVRLLRCRRGLVAASRRSPVSPSGRTSARRPLPGGQPRPVSATAA